MQTFEEMIPQNSYQKQPPFYKLDELYKTNTTTSFLYLNSKYFSNGETFLSRAPRRIEHDFIPDDDGCMAYQYSLGNIHPFTMNKFQEVYSLEGKYADICVIDRNLFAVDPEEIKEAKNICTIFDGKIVFE